MAKLIIEGAPMAVQNLWDELLRRDYLGSEFEVTFEDDEINTDYCVCPPRKWYNPIAKGICTICGKPRQ